MTETLENVVNVYGLSPIQQGMLYHTISARESGVYVNQVAVTLKGDIDRDKLIETLQVVCSRHDALRSFCVWNGTEEPLQVVCEQIEFPVTQLDWRNNDQELQRQNLLSLVETNRRTGIDPTDAPLLRFFLCRCDENKYVLLFLFHHIVLDGWSSQTLFDEILTAYDHPLTESPAFQFGNYVEHLSQRDVDAEREFWQRELSGFSRVNQLRPSISPPSTSTEHRQVSCFLTTEQTQKLRNFAKENQVTLSTVVRALWSLTVSRYSGGDTDIVFGVTNAGRPAGLYGIESGVGCFINTIPFRIKIDRDQSLRQWLYEIQQNYARSSQWETSALPDIQKHSEIGAGKSLFESILVFENYPQRDAGSHSISIENADYFEQSSYPLALLVDPKNKMEFIFLHDRNLFPDALIDRLMEHLVWLSDQITSESAETIKVLCGVPENVTMTTPVDTSVWPEFQFIDQLISQHAEDSPNHPAIVFNDQTLTYRDFDFKSNQIANTLIDSGVGPNSVVAICAENSIEMLAGILGVLKAGGSYVPIDPSYPEQHIRHVIQDANVAVVLTTKASSGALPTGMANPVFIEQVFESADGQTKPKPIGLRSPEDLAYLIYTSGSSGLPKGVQITHANLAYSNWARSQYYERNPNVFLLLSSFAFDSSVVGIFWTLSTGGTLVLPKADDRTDIHALVSLIQNQRISHLLCLPTLYHSILEAANGNELDTLETAIVAGESLSGRVIETHFARLPNTELHNEYGPTEATVWVTAHPVRREDAQNVVPIGKPIAGATVSILDAQQQPVGWGVRGEICIEGPGVAKGYLNQTELTSQKFIETDDGSGNRSRMYRTGDLGYLGDDGSIIFAGRLDRQIKIRGHRVELGAVETAMGQLDGVDEAHAIGWAPENQSSAQSLIAYAIAQKVSVSNLLQQLRRQLPAPMVPKHIYLVDSFPRLANGKVDLGRLPSPELGEANTETIGPENETQTKLLEIWRSVLGMSDICCASGSFFEIGGDSLASIQLISKINTVFGKRLSPIDLMEAPTIRQLANLLYEDSPVVKSKILIRFNNLSKGIPLVCVHAGNLDALYFRFLASHFSDRPVIALQSRGLDGKEKTLSSISDIAEDYLNEISKVLGSSLHPDSFSCDLVGYCLGASVALEMTKRLEDRGCRVRSLSIVDSGINLPVRKVYRNTVARVRAEYNSISSWLPRYLWRFLTPTLFKFKRSVWKWRMKNSPDPKKVDEFFRWSVRQDVITGHYAHISSKVQTPTLLVRSSESAADPGKSFHFDLKQYAVGGFSVAIVEGQHVQTLLEPMVEHVANAIRKHIDTASSREIDKRVQ